MTVFITDMANGTRFTQLRKEFFQERAFRQRADRASKIGAP